MRLQRVGKAKVANYRLIVSDKTKDTHDKYVELLGTYNPHDKVNGIKFIADRVKYWLGVGSTTSSTVNNLLVKAGIVQGAKRKSVYLSKSRKAKLAEKTATSATASAKATTVEKATATKEASTAPVAEASVSATDSAKATPAEEATPDKPATV